MYLWKSSFSKVLSVKFIDFFEHLPQIFVQIFKTIILWNAYFVERSMTASAKLFLKHKPSLKYRD